MFSKNFMTVAGFCLGIILTAACGGVEATDQSQNSISAAGKSDAIALVSAKTDKKSYNVDESVQVSIKNSGNLNVYLPGCNQYQIEQKVNGAWKIAPWAQKACFWEGIAVEVKGNDTYKTVEKAMTKGTFRIKVTYGVGCLPDKPLSQAQCMDEITIQSEAFEVGTTLAKENEACGADINVKCESGLYCAFGLNWCGTPPRTGVCRPHGTCGALSDCQDPNNQWFAPACVGPVVCEAGSCGKKCTGVPTCDPDKEWYRNYIGTSTEICTRILFHCPPNTKYFGNACGCGCEQDASCPKWINCMPPMHTQSCAELQEKCPYSEVAY